MKRWFGGFIVVAVLLGSFGMGEAKEKGAEYEKLAAYKKAQREKKEQEAQMPQENKAKGFWQREAERSGFAGTGAMFGNAITGLIPLDKPNSRKESK